MRHKNVMHSFDFVCPFILNYMISENISFLCIMLEKLFYRNILFLVICFLMSRVYIA